MRTMTEEITVKISIQTKDLLQKEIVCIFGEYTGPKNELNTCEPDLELIKPEDWEHINIPWAQVKQYKQAFYELKAEIKEEREA